MVRESLLDLWVEQLGREAVGALRLEHVELHSPGEPEAHHALFARVADLLRPHRLVHPQGVLSGWQHRRREASPATRESATLEHVFHHVGRISRLAVFRVASEIDAEIAHEEVVSNLHDEAEGHLRNERRHERHVPALGDLVREALAPSLAVVVVVAREDLGRVRRQVIGAIHAPLAALGKEAEAPLVDWRGGKLHVEAQASVMFVFVWIFGAPSALLQLRIGRVAGNDLVVPGIKFCETAKLVLGLLPHNLAFARVLTIFHAVVILDMDVRVGRRTSRLHALEP
mmetsp:Transcript_20533/g.39690  ORF Transcript_20533/g.39690 Transcript_20533/m.39690 type:complete len:285 (-) Transcript_20533:3800-4654(-)